MCGYYTFFHSFIHFGSLQKWITLVFPSEAIEVCGFFFIFFCGKHWILYDFSTFTETEILQFWQQFLSQATLEVVKMTTSSAASDEN